MTKLHADFETRSIINLKTQGLDRYVRDKSTAVLMLAWAFDGDEPVIWEPRFGGMPKEVCRALHSDCELVAWNSGFERNIFGHVLGIRIPCERWTDPSTFARHLSLPGSLQSVGDILGLGEEGKDKEGKRLIKLFCEPVSMGGEETLFGITEPYFAEPEKHAEDWEKFKNYCKQDVRTERKLMHLLEPFKLPPLERKIWCLDQRINDAGLPVNREFAKKALTLAERSKEELSAALKEKTGLANPNSRDQMLEWLRGQQYYYSSLEKSTVTTALNGTAITPLAREVLLIRKESAKTSYKKFAAILDRLPEDDRLRHQYLYLGAARSGRWSGSGGVQVQNLPRPTKEVEKNLEKTLAQIDLLKYDDLKADHSSVITAVTSCVRSVFLASKGKKLDVCDLNAIEIRVGAWMAGCDTILQIFREGRCPYMNFGAKLRNCRYEDLADVSVTPHKPKNKDAAEKRQQDKPPMIGCIYGLSSGVEKVCKACGHRFGYKNRCSNRKCRCDEFEFQVIWADNRYGDKVKTGLLGYAEGMGIKLSPAHSYRAHAMFRSLYSEIPQMWKDLEAGAKQVLLGGGEIQVGVVRFDTLGINGKTVLRMTLPSGRGLHYLNAKVKIRFSIGRDGEPYERESIEYDGIGHGKGAASESEGGQGTGWGPVWTSGPKLFENADQGISRDILANGMLLADEMGFEIVGSSHDEIVTLTDDDCFSLGLEDLRSAMIQRLSWAPNLPLDADGYSGYVYRKG